MRFITRCAFRRLAVNRDGQVPAARPSPVGQGRTGSGEVPRRAQGGLVGACLLALVVLLAGRRPGAAADEVAAWQALSLKYLDTKSVDLVLYGEVRLSLEPWRFGGYHLSQQVKFDPHPNLGAGVNYSFLSLPSRDSDDLTDTHRAEFEVVPRFKAGDWLEVNARQRLELRWLEGQSGMSERSRHRVQCDFPVRGDGRLRSVFLNGEVFYDYTQHEVTEYRVVPVGLTFRLAPKVNLGAYYTFQRVRSSEDWYTRHIFNTLLSVTL